MAVVLSGSKSFTANPTWRPEYRIDLEMSHA